MALTKKRRFPKKKRFTHKKLVICCLIGLLIAAGVAVYAYRRHVKNKAAPVSVSSQTSGTSGSTINLSPPTSQDKTDNNSHKDQLANGQSTSAVDTSGKKRVTPTISYVDRSTVESFVTGVFENGGVCTATLTQGSQTVTKTSTGFQNASYTQCAPISLTGVNLGKGPWTVMVSYSSASAVGKSESTILK
jgi:hypothetical protein